MDIYEVDFVRDNAANALDTALQGGHFPIVVRNMHAVPEEMHSIEKFVLFH